MSWVIAGLLASFFWALTNLLDQIVIRKYYPDQAILILTINGLIQLIPFLLFAVLFPNIFSVPIGYILIIIATSLVNTLGFITYYKALELDEASNTVPVLQLQPILIFIGAYFLFGETITIAQGIGAALIIGAAISLLIDFETKKQNLKALSLIGFCALVLSLTTIIDRYLLKNLDWTEVFAWAALGYVIFSFIIFSTRPALFRQVIARLKQPRQNGFQFIIAVEMMATIATALFLFSLATASAAGLAQTLLGFMPFFALALGYAGYKLIPDFVKKPKTGFHLGFHFLGLIIMLVGLYFIY